MAAIRVFTDEDVHAFIAQALRLRGWEALSTPEAGRLGTTDNEQLRFASENGYCTLTYNVGDFARLHYDLLSSGQMHAGIIVASQEDPRRNLRALLNLLNALSGEAMAGNLVYLSNWA